MSSKWFALVFPTTPCGRAPGPAYRTLKSFAAALVIFWTSLAALPGTAEAGVTCPATTLQADPISGQLSALIYVDATAKTCNTTGPTPTDGIVVTVVLASPYTLVGINILRNGTIFHEGLSCTGGACQPLLSNLPTYVTAQILFSTATISDTFTDSSGATDTVTFVLADPVHVPGFTVTGGLFDTSSPALSQIAPSSGPSSGGTTVTLTGTGLTGATAVKFGTTAAQSFTVDSDTQITAVTPPHASGAVDVSVTTPGGSVTKTSGFTFNGIAQAALSVSAAPATLAVNSTSTLSTTGGSGTGAVTYAVISGASSCSISGATVRGIMVGSCTVKATKAGDLTYSSASATLDFTVGKGNQAPLTVSASPSIVPAGGTSHLSTTGGSGTGAVTYAVTAGASLCSIAGTTLTATGTGTCTITATKAGDNNFLPATNALDVLVGKSAQAALTATATPASVAVNATTALSTTGGSGSGAVTYAVTAGASFCSISGTTLTGTAPGPCTVTATKAADATYTSAADSVSVTVTKAPQAALTAAATPATISAVGTSTLSTSGGSGSGAVTYTVTAGAASCSVSGTTLTGVAGGTCTVTATKAADATYASASDTVPVTVNKIAQAALSVSAAPASLVAGGSSSLSTTGGSGTGAVSYAVTAGASVCSVSGATVTGTAAGSCTVTATKAADGAHTAATAAIAFAVGKGTQAAIAVQASPAIIGRNATSALGMSGGSGTGAVSYAITAGSSFCAISGTTLTGTAAGICTVTATKAGDANFNAASGSASVEVRNAGQTIAFPKPADQNFVASGTLALSVTSSAGLPVTVTSQTLSVCTVSGTSATIVGVGTCTLVASQSGTPGVAPAASVTQSFAINPIPATVALSASAAGAEVATPVTFTATLAPSAATGHMTFKDGTTILCPNVALVAGSAQCTASFSTEGSHSITAVFTATGLYANATSAAFSLTIANTPLTSARSTGRFLLERARMVASNLFSSGRQVDRLMERAGSHPGAAQGASLAADDDADIPMGTRLESEMGLRDARTGTRALRTAIFDEGSGGGRVAALPLSGSTDNGTNVSFSSSLRDMARITAEREEQKVHAVAGLGETLAARRGSLYNPFDIWVEGKYSAFDDKDNAGGHFGVFTVGADYVVGPSLLLGVFVQLDKLKQNAAGSSQDTEGTGWLTGPYATLRLNDSLFWQVRAGWGLADNTITDPTGAGGSFASERRLVSSNLTGRWEDGDWLYQPEVSVTYFEDTAEAFTNDAGFLVPEVASHLGEAKAGGVVSYRYVAAGDVLIEPRAGMHLVWDFAADAKAGRFGQVAGNVVAEGVRGRSEVGIKAVTASGIGVDVSGSYDGIGSNSFSAATGRAELAVPLN